MKERADRAKQTARAPTAGWGWAAAAFVVSAITLLILERNGALQASLLSLAGADPGRLVLALVCVPAIQYFRAWRFMILIDGRTRAPDFPMYRSTAILAMLNFLIPFRVGEISFPLMMRRGRGVPLGRGAAALVLTRGVDLLAIIALCALAAAAAIGRESLGISRPILVAAAAAGLGACFLLPSFGLRLGHGLRRRLRPTSRLSSGLDNVLGTLAELHGSVRALQFSALTLAVWGTFIAGAYFAAAAVAPAIGLAEAAFGYTASSLAFALPINGLAGLGPTQAAWWSALTLSGIESETAIVIALVGHGTFLAGSVLLGVALLPVSLRK